MFENAYPYTDFHELNLDWVISKIDEFQTKIESFESEVLAEAKTYTDEQITSRLAGIESEFTTFKTEVDSAITAQNSTIATYRTEIYARLTITENKFKVLETKVDSVLKEANAYTNYAIQQNNTYIIDQTTKALSTVKVINYFTGARVSLQEMFDYLAQFHLENAATYAELSAADKTYDEMIAYNEDYTNWVLNGKTIINS